MRMKVHAAQIAAAIVAWLLVAVALLTCSSCAPDEPDDRREITGACQRSFRPTLEAWEGALGRVPSDCAYLDDVYSVQLLPPEDAPCMAAELNQLVTGCTEHPSMAIYILDVGRTNVDLVNTSVHEWIHALAQCVDGDMDVEHTRVELWYDLSVENSVEAEGQAFATIGECI